MKRINPYKKFNGIHIPEGITRIPIKKLSHGAKICYGRLARYAGKDGICFPRIKTLAAEIGVKRRAVDGYLKELRDFGLIQSERRGLNKSNKYFFLDHEILRTALIGILKDADKDISEMREVTDNEESHNKEGQVKEGQLSINPDGLESGLSHKPFDGRTSLLNDTKEIIMAYAAKVSKTYKPQYTSETPGLIKLALKRLTKKQILEGIDRYSRHTWWMEHTARHGINWYFKDIDQLEEFTFLVEKIWNK